MMFGFASWPAGSYEGPHARMVPEYVHALYNVTHSLVIYGLFFALLYGLGRKRFAKLTLGWPLHILVDIPVHAASFFPTPFLWPVSDFHIDGTPWGRPEIFFPNVVIIIALYAYWYIKRRQPQP